jgi:TolB protein
MNADGSGQTRLTSHPAYDGAPAWTQDGGKIAFVSYRSGGYRIHVMNAGGSNAVQLSGQPYRNNPVWSPDGTKLTTAATATMTAGRRSG